jgi:hypothetical protein
VQPIEENRWKTESMPPALRIPSDFSTIQSAFRNTAVRLMNALLLRSTL